MQVECIICDKFFEASTKVVKYCPDCKASLYKKKQKSGESNKVSSRRSKMPNSTYKLNRYCDCGKKITDQSTTGKCFRCYTSTSSFGRRNRVGAKPFDNQKLK